MLPLDHEVTPVKLVDHKLAIRAASAVLLFPAFIREHLLILGPAVAHVCGVLLPLSFECLEGCVEAVTVK
jgi:hypothetical protein